MKLFDLEAMGTILSKEMKAILRLGEYDKLGLFDRQVLVLLRTMKPKELEMCISNQADRKIKEDFNSNTVSQESADSWIHIKIQTWIHTYSERMIKGIILMKAEWVKFQANIIKSK